MKKRSKLLAVISYLLLFTASYAVFEMFVRGSFLDPFSGKIATAETFHQIDPETEIHQGRSEIAYSNCNEYAKENSASGYDFDFSDGEFGAWDLSSGRLLIKSYLYQPDAGGVSVRKDYTCRIKFNGGDYKDSGNWEVTGLDIGDG